MKDLIINISEIAARLVSRKLCLIAALLFLLNASLQAQLEYNHWWWSDSNGLDFNYSPPQPYVMPYSFLNAYTSPACISNKYGQKLFCATGGQVLDRHNNPMQGTNLYNPTTSIQRGFVPLQIVPWPCNDSLYLIFLSISSGFSVNNLLTYAVVNINGNGGLGTVSAMIDTLDNFKYDFEIVKHANNRDFWLVTSDNYDYRIYKSFLISDTGVSNIPLISTTGPYIAGSLPVPIQLTISPDSKFLVQSRGKGGSTNYGNQGLTPFVLNQFDNATGVVQYLFPLEDTVNIDSTLHNVACFSPNSKVLYYNWNRGFAQLDLSVLNYDSIQNSKTIIAEVLGPQTFGDLKLGPDDNIYSPAGGIYQTLHVIEHPDSLGAACGLTIDSIQLGQRSLYTLPKHIIGLYTKRHIQHQTYGCTGVTNLFWFDNVNYLDSVWWFIGESGSSPQQFFVSDSSAAVVIDSAGIYPIMAVTYSGCRLDTFYDTVTVLLTPAPNLGPDTILCEGDTIAISNDWAYSYLWNTGDTTDGIQILVPDTYWLELSNFCGVARDTVVVDSIIEALVVFPAVDTLLCVGETLVLDASVDLGTYLWHDGSTNPTFSAFVADTIWATAVNACGTSSDTISVRFTDVPILTHLDSILCVGDTQFINLYTDSLSTFLWYSGDTSGFDTITTENHYWVRETNLCGMDIDTFFVAFVSNPIIDLGNDTVFCGNSPLTLVASTRFGSYNWSTGTSDSTFTTNAAFFNANDSIEVFVTVTNACTSVQDSILLVADFPLSPDLGNDTVVCFNASLLLDPWSGRAESRPDTSRAAFLWSDFSTSDFRQWIVVRDSTISVSVTNTCGTYSNEIKIWKDDTLKPFLGNDTILCFGDTLVLRPLDFGSAQPALNRIAFIWRGFVNDQEFIVLDSARTDQTLVAGDIYLPLEGKTVYLVNVSNTCNTAKDRIELRVDSLPELIGFDTIRFCNGDSVLFSFSKDDINSLSWNDGYGFAERSLSESRIWTIKYFNHCGTSSEKLAVERQYPPAFRLAESIKFCEDFVELIPEVDYNRFEVFYDWSTGEQTKSIFVDSLGFYRVSISDEFGCADSAQIRVITCGADFYAPNAFTPGKNQINDTWDISAPGMENYEITIFDRWGNAIYTFRKNQGGWDGTINGEPCQAGVYTWIMLESTENIQYSRQYIGKITLIR